MVSISFFPFLALRKNSSELQAAKTFKIITQLNHWKSHCSTLTAPKMTMAFIWVQLYTLLSLNFI